MFSKKILSGLLCFTMLFSMSIPATAAELTATDSKDVKVTNGMSEGFLVTIPTNRSYSYR